MGYHLSTIPKGTLGEVSKIEEELRELQDALQQSCKIMAIVECADLYGALEAFVNTRGYTMDDLRTMSDITRRAFATGERV